MKYNTVIAKDDNISIIHASELIKVGEVVGMPTETVYGLAADAVNEEAVKKIFEAKGRPQDNPLICHICNMGMLEKYTSFIPDLAYKLAEAFWPGPLTMILPKNDLIPLSTSGGLDTVGIRFPAHRSAQKLIELSGTPLAAPSANLSGSPSPTTAKHVYDDMNGRIPYIIDGGDSEVGVESTVISFENNSVRILRPGFISAEDLLDITENVIIDNGIMHSISETDKVRSPGMKYKHYSPKADVTIVDGNLIDFIKYVQENKTENTYSMIFNSDKENFPYKALVYGDTSEEQAALIFKNLREFDELGADRVFVRSPEKDGVGLAVYNRLLRAAAFKVIKL